MKKTLASLLLLISFLLVSQKPTFAVTTVYFGKMVNGVGVGYDYSSAANPKLTGDLDTFVVNFTNISELKKVKVDIDYEFGKYTYLQGPPSMELWDLQVGFPVVNREKGLVYLTLGAHNYAENTPFNPKHETNGALVGVNIACIPSDRFQIEADIQHSLGNLATAKLYYSDVTGTLSKTSTLDLTILTMKAQIILTDNLGLAVRYRWFDENISDPRVDAVDLYSTTMGFIYRF
ncbi:MAG: hypothetical protein ACM3X9_00515 [Bacillota bacterium]